MYGACSGGESTGTARRLLFRGSFPMTILAGSLPPPQVNGRAGCDTCLGGAVSLPPPQGEVPSASEAEGVKALSRPRFDPPPRLRRDSPLRGEQRERRGDEPNGRCTVAKHDTLRGEQRERRGGEPPIVALSRHATPQGEVRSAARRRGSKRCRDHGSTPLPSLRIMVHRSNPYHSAALSRSMDHDRGLPPEGGAKDRSATTVRPPGPRTDIGDCQRHLVAR